MKIIKRFSKITKDDIEVFNNNGITLIALVITIILLLILASIALTQLSENGIFGKAKLAKERTQYTAAKEILEIKLMDIQADCIYEEKEYTIIEIAKNIKDDNKITIEKYYMSKTSSTNVQEPEDLTTLQGIVVSVDEYAKYKFLIGESCKIIGVTIEEIPDLIENFESIDEFEEEILNNIEGAKYYKITKNLGNGIIILGDERNRIPYNEPYKVTITTEGNYILDTLNVMMGDKVIDVDLNTGEIDISEVTGDIKISADTVYVGPNSLFIKGHEQISITGGWNLVNQSVGKIVNENGALHATRWGGAFGGWSASTRKSIDITGKTKLCCKYSMQDNIYGNLGRILLNDTEIGFDAGINATTKYKSEMMPFNVTNETFKWDLSDIPDGNYYIGLCTNGSNETFFYEIWFE